MALEKDNLYWKVSNIEVDRIGNIVNITLKGYKDKASSDNHDLQKQNKFVKLSKEYYPFTNGLTVDQISNLYSMIKKSDSYFKDATDA